MIEAITGLSVIFGLLLLGAIGHAARVVDERNVTDPFEVVGLVVDGLKWPLLVVGQGIIAMAQLTHRHRFERISPTMLMLMCGEVDTSPRCRCGARKPSPTLQPPGDPPAPPPPRK